MERKKPPAPIGLTVVAAIIPEGGLAPSLNRAKIEHEQHEMGEQMIRIENN